MDGIEKDYAGELVILRVDVQDPIGQALAREYNFLATPTFIFFDASGNELWRSIGQLDPQQVAQSINQ